MPYNSHFISVLNKYELMLYCICYGINIRSLLYPLSRESHDITIAITPVACVNNNVKQYLKTITLFVILSLILVSQQY